MLNSDFSLFLDLTPPQCINYAVRVSEPLIGASLCGKPNKPNKPWRDAPTSREEKISADMVGETNSDFADVASQIDRLTGENPLENEISGDALLGSPDCEYLTETRGDDAISGQDIMSVVLLVDTARNLTSWQDFIAWTEGLPSQQMGIQQQGRDTLISLGSEPIMLLTNLDATFLINAMSPV